MNFLDQIFFDNTIKSYIIVVAVVLSALLAKRILSKYITSIVFKMGKTQWRGISKEKFDDIILDPFERIFIVLVVIFAFGSLKFPDALQFTFFKVSTKDALKSVVAAVFIISIVSLILRFMDFVILTIKTKSTIQERSEHQLLYFFRDFIRVVLIIFAIAFILRFSFKIDIGNLLTGLSIVGAALALAARESLENLIASFVIFFDKPFETGEVVKIREFVGSVEKIGLRSTRIRTFDSTLVTVPNKQMVDNMLDNWSKRRLVKNELKTVLPATTPSENILRAVHEIKTILSKQADVKDSQVYLEEITKDSTFITAIYFSDISLPHNKVNQLRQSLNISIKKMQEEFDSNNAPTQN
ncbi:MAG: mechanosensitive ion channel domain-containing protein [Ginsengibacter sp.]